MPTNGFVSAGRFGRILRGVNFRPGYTGFLAFCKAVDYTELKPFQRRIAKAHFGGEREVVAILPRGSAKSTLAALLALHHALTVERPGVYVGAASRDQARVIGGMVRALVQHDAVRDQLVWRTDAVRWAQDPKGPAIVTVLASDGSRAHGHPHPTLYIGDELWAWSDREPTLLGAFMTALLKNPGCRFLGVSTAAASLDSPLGHLRRRAMNAPEVERKGAVLEAGGDGLRWLEWSVPENGDPDDLRAVTAANPLRTLAEMREQRKRVTEVEWLQFHAGMWGVGSARWLPPGAWQACRAVYEVGPEEPLVLGVDVGGSRSATAVVGCVADDEGVRVATVEIWQGRDAVLRAARYIADLAAAGRPIREVVYDPMRFDSEAQRLERDLRVDVVEWPQSETRMTRCSENVHRLIIEGRLRHPGDRELDAHVSNAHAKPTARGWRLVKASDGAQIDGLIALAMAAERAEQPAPELKFHGFL